MTGEIAVHMETRLDLCAARKGDAHRPPRGRPPPGVGAALSLARSLAHPEQEYCSMQHRKAWGSPEWALHRGTGYFPIGNKAGIGAGIFGIVAGGTLLC